MDGYFFAKWIHIVSATILFGTGIGTAAHMWFTHLSGNVQAIAVATRNTVRADWIFTATSGVVQPVSGFALIWLAGHDPLAFWLVLSYGLYIAAGVCWGIVVWIQIRTKTLAGEAVENGSALPPAYTRLMTLWFMLGWPAFLALIAIFALMVRKPAAPF